MWISLFAVLLLLASTVSPAATTTLSVGVVPQQTPTRLVRLWAPLLNEVGRRSGYRLDFRTAPDIPAFEQRVAAGEYDLVYINPYKYTEFHRAPGYRAFAREEGRLQSIVVVRTDSPIQSVAELHRQPVAFPAPVAFAATVVPLAQLHQQRIEPVPSYVTSHDSVYLAVVKGLYPAGGGVRRTFDQMPADVRARLRVLWTSSEFAPHAIAAHPRVPASTVERVRRAMIELKQEPAGRAALERAGFTGIVAAQDSDWNDIRALRIERLDPLWRGGLR